MGGFLGWLVNVLILGTILCACLWVLALLLDLAIPRLGLPVEFKRLVLALVGLVGLIAILLGGYRVVLI